jgi:hypothetical protein
MPDKTTKTLTDADISTLQRRAGPSGATPGTDADTHVASDADSAPTPVSESDAATDSDSGH